MSDDSQPLSGASVARREIIPLPALVAIAFYLFLQAGICIFAVVSGQLQPRQVWPAYLFFAAMFLAAAGGLFLLFRWAWSLALAAVVLIGGLYLWRFSAQHDGFSLVQGLLNLVFFLYLVRPEVRSRLR